LTMIGFLLFVILNFPHDLLTVKTPELPEKMTVSIMDAGFRIRDFYFSISPIFLPVYCNFGVSFIHKNLIAGGHFGFFYGEYLLKSLDENIKDIDISANGFNIFTGYKFRRLILNFKLKFYGNYRAVDIEAASFFKPLILEMGYEFPQGFTYGVGFYFTKAPFFAKFGIIGPGIEDFGKNIPCLPYFNAGVIF